VQRDCDDDEVREAVFGQCSILVAADPATGRDERPSRRP
jgi:hypothetical protein